MRSSSWLGLLLVVGGAVYLMSIFHIVHLQPKLWTWDTIWSLLMVVLGLGGLRGFRRTIPWGAIFLLLYGVFLFLKTSALVPRLADISADGVFWSFVLIYLGMSVFAPKRFGGWRSFIIIQRNGSSARGNSHSTRGPRRPRENDGNEASWDEDEDQPGGTVDNSRIRRVELSFPEAFPHGQNWQPKSHMTRHWIGDVSLGSEPWVLEDMSVWNGVGDVRINLATAHLEDRTYNIRVEGWVGDVRILVPASIPVAVHADVSIGDVNVFQHAESGTGRSVFHTDDVFESAVRRLQIGVNLKIGDVQIVRV